MRHLFSHTKPAPSDAEFEALRRRHARLVSGTDPARTRNRAALIVAGCILLVVLSAAFFPNHPLASTISSAACGIVSLWLFTLLFSGAKKHDAKPRSGFWESLDAKALERRQLNDQLRRRPDRCVCPACAGTMLIDDKGHAACTACDHTADRQGWPLTELVAPEELEPIAGPAHAPLTEQHERTRRALFRVRLATTPVLIAISAGWLWILSLNAPLPLELWVSFALVVVLGSTIDRLHKRRLAIEALLATRPDLWDPILTPMPLSELERLNERPKQRARVVRVARRVLARTAANTND